MIIRLSLKQIYTILKIIHVKNQVFKNDRFQSIYHNWMHDDLINISSIFLCCFSFISTLWMNKSRLVQYFCVFFYWHFSSMLSKLSFFFLRFFYIFLDLLIQHDLVENWSCCNIQKQIILVERIFVYFLERKKAF